MRYRYCEVSCDRQTSSDCEEQFGPEPSLTEVVKKARKAGWYVGPANREEDACPSCREVSK